MTTMIQQQQQETDQWVLTSVQLNLMHLGICYSNQLKQPIHYPTYFI